jgi:hypothetical protein
MQDDSSADSSPTTPPNHTTSTAFSAELSPPDSQQLSAQIPNNAPSPFTPLASGAGKAAANTGKKMPPSANLNANGKRSWGENSNAAPAAGVEGGKGGTEKESGYTWEKEEDAPGYSWANTKAREEAARAWGTVVDKERKIGNKYGDVLA